MESKGGESTELPFAQGRHFEALDDYLAFLERRGATGVPFYRLIAPDRYALVSGRGRGIAPVELTRAELAARFGFTE